ncbi:MAG: hypothetical protein NTZ53_14960 [Cyanobacteria bacterium]|nr:hypothetical protein [Cyanobacteriota bacterium]
MNHPLATSSPNHSAAQSALAIAAPAQASSALAPLEPAPPAQAAPTEVLQVFSGLAAFDAAQRMARALCSSTLVPKEYQGQQGLANSLIALEIAGRMRLSPLVVMQNMTPIHGRPTWSSKFLIATVNASGRFSPLRFVFDNPQNPTRCHAVATDKATAEVLEGETITLELARKEGWWSRKDRQGNETSKWQTMTGQMLRYRAAAWWANVYCPEIALGLITQEEALDIEPVKAVQVEPAAPSNQGIAPASRAAIPTNPATPAAMPWLEDGSQTQAPGPSSATSQLDGRETEASTAEVQNTAPIAGVGPAQSAEVNAGLPSQNPASPSPTAAPEPGPAPKDKPPTGRAKPAARSSQANPSPTGTEPVAQLQQSELVPVGIAVRTSEPVAASPPAEALLTGASKEPVPVEASPAQGWPAPYPPHRQPPGVGERR